jgi:hypothetical protein
MNLRFEMATVASSMMMVQDVGAAYLRPVKHSKIADIFTQGWPAPSLATCFTLLIPLGKYCNSNPPLDITFVLPYVLAK